MATPMRCGMVRVRVGDQEARLYPQGGIGYCHKIPGLPGWVVCDEPDAELERAAEYLRTLYFGPRDLPPDADTVPVGWEHV